MSAVWQLGRQLARKAPLLVILSGALWLCALGAMAFGRATGDAGVALTGWLPLLVGCWFWHIGQGQMLADLCRPESALLPRFRRRLAQWGLVDTALWLLPPVLLGGSLATQYTLVAGGGLLLVGALGVATGTGRRAALAIWAVFILVGWKPELAARLGKQALVWPLTPLVLALLAMLLLGFVLLPLLHIEDPEPDVSPLAGLGNGRSGPAGAVNPRRGKLVTRVGSIFDATAQQALDRALARFRRRQGQTQRLALVRSLLLPHDNALALALRLILIAAAATAYFFAIQHRQHFDAAVIGAYAIVLTMARFPQLGRGMQRMQPNLSDLYLTLAPATRADYQRTLAHALLLLVPVSVVSALAYTVLGAVLVHAAQPARMLLTAMVVIVPASFVGLALHLIGPRGSFGRSVVQITLVLGSMLAYWGGYMLLGAIGLLNGSVLLGVLSWSFGAAVWWSAQREYQRRDPVFDAPAA